jgi:ParB-like chromosome segregation protein Spo0J
MELIEIDRIDRADTRFCVSFPLEDPLLFKSINAFGIRMPLLLLDTAPYTVVTGFKRLDVACRLGLTTVPCSIRAMNEKDALLTALNDNITRPLNMIEGALGIDKMSRLGLPGEEIYAMMKLLGHEPHEKLLRNLLEIARADSLTREFLVKQKANMTHVELLLGFSSGERSDVIALLAEMHPTSSQLREILQLLLLVKVKEGGILFEEYPRSTIGADELRISLKKRTHPMLSILEHRLKEVLAKAALPPWVSVKVDPFFEKVGIEIDIRAHRVEDAEEAIRGLDSLIKNGWLRSIFELTKGTHRN